MKMQVETVPVDPPEAEGRTAPSVAVEITAAPPTLPPATSSEPPAEPLSQEEMNHRRSLRVRQNPNCKYQAEAAPSPMLLTMD
jgi:hypothetical protein